MTSRGHNRAHPRLIVSPDPGARRQLLIERYAEALRQNVHNTPDQGEHALGPCLWIAPSRAAAAELRRALAEETPGAWLSPGVRTLSQTVDALLSRSRATLRPLSTVQQLEIQKRIVEELARRRALGPLEPLVDANGLQDYLLRRINEARRLGLPPEEIAELFAKREAEVGRALGKVYGSYAAALDRHNLVDYSGRVLVASDEASQEIALAMLVVAQPVDPSPVEMRLVGRLAACAEHVFIEALGDHDSVRGKPSPRFLAAHDAASAWRTALPDACIEAVPAQPRPDEFTLLRDRLFDDDNHEKPSPLDAPCLAIIAGSSAQDELRSVAQRVKGLLLDQRVPADEIVIAARRSSQLGARLQGVLLEYGVPFVAEPPEPIRGAPRVRAMQRVLRVADTDWGFEELLALIGAEEFSGFARSSEGSDRSLRHDAERFLRELQSPSGAAHLRAQAEKQATKAAEGASSNPLNACARGAMEAYGMIADAIDALPERAAPIEWLDALDAALERLGYRGAAPNDTQAARALLVALGEVETLAHWRGDEPPRLTLGAFLTLLESLARRVTIRPPQREEGRVRVVTADTALGLEIGHLFLVGLVESSFSASEAPLGVADGPAGSTPQDREMLLFYELATRAKRSLTLSYPALDGKAQTLKPCPYVEDIQGLFKDRLHRSTTGEAIAKTISEPHSPREQRLEAIAQAVSREGDSLGVYAASDVGRETLDALRVAYERSHGDTFGPAEGVFAGGAAALAKRYGPEHHWSASQLEQYATCPFRFFAQQVLGAEPTPDTALDIDHRRRGSLVHDALALLHAELTGGAGEAGPADLTERLREKLSDWLAQQNLPLLEGALAQIEALQAESWAEGYAQQTVEYEARWSELDEPLRPRWFEARFGPARGESLEDGASTDRPFAWDLSEGERVLLTGRIDRIDVGSVGGHTVFSVIDYKTGAKVSASLEDVLSGRKLQPVLYALAAQELFFGDESATPIATGYWAVQSRGFVQPKDLAPAEITATGAGPTVAWQETVDALRTRVSQIVRDVRAGRFPMHNVDENCGRYCDYRTVCRVAQTRHLHKQWPPEQDEPTGGEA